MSKIKGMISRPGIHNFQTKFVSFPDLGKVDDGYI